jgi:hypothetical protein
MVMYMIVDIGVYVDDGVDFAALLRQDIRSGSIQLGVE